MTSITPSPAPELKTYTGGCACSAFQYTVKFPEITSVYECNCSICVRKGYKWLFPGEGCFEITKIERKLKVYEFAGKGTAHHFCSVCGTGVFAMKHASPPGRQRGLNVRTLNDIDILFIPVAPAFNGAAITPLYEPVKESLLTSTPSEKVYIGSCHCQDTTLSFITSTPVSELQVTECTCDKCVRTAPLLLTLPVSQISVASVRPSSISYTNTSTKKRHEFCSTCGVCITVQDTLDLESVPMLNLRCFNESIELAKLNVARI